MKNEHYNFQTLCNSIAAGLSQIVSESDKPFDFTTEQLKAFEQSLQTARSSTGSRKEFDAFFDSTDIGRALKPTASRRVAKYQEEVPFVTPRVMRGVAAAALAGTAFAGYRIYSNLASMPRSSAKDNTNIPALVINHESGPQTISAESYEGIYAAEAFQRLTNIATTTGDETINPKAREAIQQFVTAAEEYKVQGNELLGKQGPHVLAAMLYFAVVALTLNIANTAGSSANRMERGARKDIVDALQEAVQQGVARREAGAARI